MCTAGSLALAPTAAQAGAPKDKRPNILIILTDDQRFDTAFKKIMPKTHKKFRTQGVRYKNGVVTTSLCCPSRVSIFSGRYAHNHGVHKNGGKNALAAWEPDKTIQHELKQEGYKTAISGKYLSTWQGDPPDFDRWATQTRPAANYYYDATFNINGNTKKVPIHATKFTRNKAIRFLKRFEAQDATPWFMQISPLAPHLPSTPFDQHRGADLPPRRLPPSIREKRRDKPAYVRQIKIDDIIKTTNFKWRRMNRTLMGVDTLVRDVYAWLKANGEAHNTLAFFTSDNGFMLGEHGLIKKQVPYEEAIRVPFFMRWPAGDGVKEGSIRYNIAANIDIAPTVYDVTDADVDYTFDGKSLFGRTKRDTILVESLDDKKVPAWAGLWSPQNDYAYFTYSTDEREYYDLAADPYQLKNLLGNRSTSDDPRTVQHDVKLEAAKICEGVACP